MMHADWLQAVMQGSFSEILVCTLQDGRIVHANPAACEGTGLAPDALAGRTIDALTDPVALPALHDVLARLRAGATGPLAFDTIRLRAGGDAYPLACRAFRSGDACILVGHDLSSQQARTASDAALRASEARFHAVAANVPGLVWQYRLDPAGRGAFTYASEACRAVLDIAPEVLCADAARFHDAILEEDRAGFRQSMDASRSSLQAWNWSGRLRIAGWNDIKWIDLRASPVLLADGTVQWDGIMANVTRSKKEEAAARRSRAELAELSAHDDIVKEQERTRIAREIHDDLGGNLTAIKMALALLARRLPAGDETLAAKAAYVDALIDRSIEAVHRIAGDLRPGVLDFGLAAAIDWQAGEFRQQTGLACGVDIDADDSALEPEAATALFRIFQEALTNVARHAAASRVDVRLRADGDALLLEIEDDGRGISDSDRRRQKSFGIRGMMERAGALGGELRIGAGRSKGKGNEGAGKDCGNGTIVAVRLPLHAAGDTGQPTRASPRA